MRKVRQKKGFNHILRIVSDGEGTLFCPKWQNWDLNLGRLASEKSLWITKEEQVRLVYSNLRTWQEESCGFLLGWVLQELFFDDNWLKKNIQPKIATFVLFGDLNEDYSPGNSFSDSSEEQFWRGKERARMHSVGVFARGKQTKHVVKHWKITASHKSRYLQLMVLVLSCVWEGARVWARWSYSLYMHLI